MRSELQYLYIYKKRTKIPVSGRIRSKFEGLQKKRSQF